MVEKNKKMVTSLPLTFFESSGSVKEIPDRKIACKYAVPEVLFLIVVDLNIVNGILQNCRNEVIGKNIKVNKKKL